jgi:hypothetical protein
MYMYVSMYVYVSTVRLTIEGLDGLEGTAAGMLTIAL